jgi:hypothetical protein
MQKRLRLRLSRFTVFGSPTWARTRDLRINSPSLYRLSYRGMVLQSPKLYPHSEFRSICLVELIGIPRA